MSTYINNDDSIIIIIDDDQIEEIDLLENSVLEKLVINNCTALLSVKFNVETKIDVRIENCPLLESIYNTAIFIIESKFYLGKGCDNLKSIDIYNIYKVFIEEYPLLNLKRLNLYIIQILKVNPSLYENLEFLSLSGCVFPNMVIVSDYLIYLELYMCLFETFKHVGINDNLETLLFSYNEYDTFEVEHVLNRLSELDIISNKGENFYILLPLVINHEITITLDSKTNYDTTLTNFIDDERNNVELYTIEIPDDTVKEIFDYIPDEDDKCNE